MEVSGLNDSGNCSPLRSGGGCGGGDGGGRFSCLLCWFVVDCDCCGVVCDYVCYGPSYCGPCVLRFGC